MTTLPAAVHELVEYEVLAAWHYGYTQALADAAERSAALDATWLPAPRHTHEQAVAARAAGMSPAEGVAAWLRRYHDGWIRHDAGCIDTGRRATPIATWPQVHEYVDAHAWARIIDDLAPGPRGSRDAALAATTGREAAA